MAAGIEGFSTEDWRRLGTAIRQARAATRLSQKEAAAQARISPTTWREIERGQKTGVRILTLAAIAEVLNWHSDAPVNILFGADPNDHDPRLAGDVLSSQILELDERMAAVERQVEEIVGMLRDRAAPG